MDLQSIVVAAIQASQAIPSILAAAGLLFSVWLVLYGVKVVSSILDARREIDEGLWWMSDEGLAQYERTLRGSRRKAFHYARKL